MMLAQLMSAYYRQPFARWLLEQLAARPQVTQAVLAQALGVGQQRISDWLSGRRRPRETNCLRLARFFGADPVTVLALAGYQANLAPPPAREAGSTSAGGPRSIREEAAEWLARLPVAIPIYEEYACDKPPGPAVDYAYWDPARVAGRQIWGIRMQETALEPQIHVGDTVYVELGRPPAPGDIVLACSGDRMHLRRYLETPDGPALEDQEGARHPTEAYTILGVAIGSRKDFLR